MEFLMSPKNRKAIEAEACAWIAQLDGATASREDLAALREWLGRSPAHRHVFQQLAAVWGETNILTQLAVPRPVHRRHRWRRPLAALAVCCLTLGVAIVIWKLPPQSTVPPATRVSVAVPEPARTYITRIGEQRRIELPDGSHLTLNTGTRVTVAFIDRQRRLQLEAGEALFEVVPDAHRPFLVYAGSGLVRALGTVFSVYLRDTGHVSVLVAEGKVQLASVATQQTAAGEPPGMPLAVLGAGKVASFGNAVDSVESLPQAELSRRLAWREGLVKFDGEPLWQVVEEVSRYTTLKILIRDTHTANMRIGGHFKIGGTDALFEALQSGFGLRIERVGKDTVYLSRDSG